MGQIVDKRDMGLLWRERLPTYSLYLVIGLILIVMPLVVPVYFQGMLTRIIIFAIFALSLNLIWGYCGLISLGHAAYFGISGYVVAILMVRFGIESFWLLAPAGILVATLFSAFFGIIALRVSGVYFLLITLALGKLVYSISIKWRALTGGENGLPGVSFPDLGLPGFAWNSTYFYFFVLAFFIICFFLLYRITKSPLGHALQGIRNSESRMRNLGYNTWLFKYIAFIIAGIFAGIAGVLFVYLLGMAAPQQVDVITSTLVILMVIIGGSTVFWGPVIGAVVMILLQYFSSLLIPARWPLILGGVLILSVIALPQGISVYLLKGWNKLRAGYGSLKN